MQENEGFLSRRDVIRGAVGATAAGTVAAEPAVAQEGTTHTVDMTDQLVFDPEELTIAPGDTVVWENVGTVGHSVTAYEEEIPEDAEFFASGGLESEQAARDSYPSEGDVPGGESYQHSFEVEGEYGQLDVMVNNAGIASDTPVEEMELDEWRNVVQTDLDGVMHGTKAALPYLEESNGCIINTASIYGLVGGKGAAAYSAAKGGVVNFTQQVAVDYADRGVRVNSICPGFVETPMTEELLERDTFYNYVRDETPMDRPAQPEEIAPLAVFLASDGASYMTGANVPIDGGWTAH